MPQFESQRFWNYHYVNGRLGKFWGVLKTSFEKIHQDGSLVYLKDVARNRTWVNLTTEGYSTRGREKQPILLVLMQRHRESNELDFAKGCMRFRRIEKSFPTIWLPRVSFWVCIPRWGSVDSMSNWNVRRGFAFRVIVSFLFLQSWEALLVSCSCDSSFHHRYVYFFPLIGFYDQYMTFLFRYSDRYCT